MKKINVKKIVKNKFVLAGFALFLAVGIFNAGRLSAFFSNNKQHEVLAYIDSNASDHEKIVMLEKRYNNEVSSLNTLLNHSDLCSGTYTNELSTIEMNMEVTIQGFEKLFKDKNMSNYPAIASKADDYEKVEKALENLNSDITKTDYKAAISEVETMEELLNKEYRKIDKEVADFGK